MRYKVHQELYSFLQYVNGDPSNASAWGNVLYWFPIWTALPWTHSVPWGKNTICMHWNTVPYVWLQSEQCAVNTFWWANIHVYLNCSYFIATLGDFYLNIRTCYIMYSCYNPVWYFCAVLALILFHFLESVCAYVCVCVAFDLAGSVVCCVIGCLIAEGPHLLIGFTFIPAPSGDGTSSSSALLWSSLTESLSLVWRLQLEAAVVKKCFWGLSSLML